MRCKYWLIGELDFKGFKGFPSSSVFSVFSVYSVYSVYSQCILSVFSVFSVYFLCIQCIQCILPQLQTGLWISRNTVGETCHDIVEMFLLMGVNFAFQLGLCCVPIPVLPWIHSTLVHYPYSLSMLSTEMWVCSKSNTLRCSNRKWRTRPPPRLLPPQ